MLTKVQLIIFITGFLFGLTVLKYEKTKSNIINRCHVDAVSGFKWNFSSKRS